MKRTLALFAATLLAVFTPAAPAQVANIKVVTDANPDYTDMESLAHATTSNWKTDAEKMWAVFYWTHIGRRMTGGVRRHGFEITDPIRHFNDFGYTHFVGTAGLQISQWTYMGYPARPVAGARRSIVLTAKLPELLDRIKHLERKVTELGGT